ncbi:NUDIX domain-containing protein [Flavobacteriaceae bacterium XHP0103]|uniref:NUDIX hydrolase n=1 Tax=Marixanthotalea marina TaxID=2844359 RepID=UPI002989B8AC|nr:NUDIX domain-containing protein [Marixanthotalea marina]MBU3822829.1 NUDIX domain-containing protein [Marixanthotalea marina]
MDEYIDVANEQGELTGKKELKSVIHKKGLYHHTAHIWLYTKKGEILLSQRSAKKVICPLLWDVSVAGHIDAGESIVNGALREMQEEIGLTLSENDLMKIGVFSCFQNYDNGIKDYEFHNTFIAELKIPISELKPQLEEVENIKLVSFDEFELLLKHSGANGHFVPSNRIYYETVLKSIKGKM